MTPTLTRRALSTAIALVALAVALCARSAFAAPASQSTTLPPHVATEYDTDVCGMCHRTHTSFSGTKWTSAVASDVSGSALVIGSAGKGDTGLCYSCHGVDALGSGVDVQSSFDASSGHSLDPSSSPFGPSPKQCSTCHDSHGTARVTSGTPFPALLRSATATGTLVYSGNEYCATCHVARAGSSFHGLSVFRQTAHAKKIAPPSTGTGIVCDACHDPHGSDVAPTMRTTLATPSVAVATPVTANDRTFCFACHTSAYGTWNGASSYHAAHASSTATVPIAGTWAPPGSSRRVGECQVCHNPTGSADASGVLIPSMLELPQPTLCYRCHGAAGPAASNVASLAYSPTTPGNEVLGLFAGVADPTAYGRLQVYSRESTAASTPVGPRQLAPVSVPGALALGDIDGDGVKEALVTDAANARIAVLSADPLAGTKSRLLALPLPADPATFVSVADVFVDGSGLPEIVTMSAAGTIDVLRYSGGSLVRVASTTVVGTPTGLATGDVTATPAADIAVSTSDGLFIIAANGPVLAVGGPYVAGAQPSAVAVGNAWPNAANEVVVSYAGEATNVVTIFNGNGGVIASGGGPLPAGTATAVLVGDVLPGVAQVGTSGDEIVLAYADSAGDSGVRVIPQLAGGGFGTPLDYATGARSNISALAIGDANGDGEPDLAVAAAGSFTRTTSAVAPSVRVYKPNGAGDTLQLAFTLPVGGVEFSGGTPAVAIGDIGAVGPSRHAADAVAGAHVPTETVPSPRHVVCSDCHDSHLASVAASSTPALPGAMIGARGVVPTNVDAVTVSLSGPTTATADFEVCFKCHSKWEPSAPRSVASEVNTLGASFHPVEGAARPTNAVGATMVPGMSVGDTTSCGSCHGTSLTGVATGPHTSPESPLLKGRYFGATVDDTSLLCYRCHKDDVYLSGVQDTSAPGGPRSGFFDSGASAPKQALHSYHTSMGFGCASCHVSHGSTTLPYLLRSDGFTFTDPAGAVDGECASSCHSGGAVHGYTR